MYAVTAMVVWLTLLMQKHIQLVPFSWRWVVVSEFFGQLSIAFATSALAAYSDSSADNMRNFISRIAYSLLTVLTLSLGYGFFAWAFSFLPTIARIPFIVIGGLLSYVTLFSAPIASACRILPSQAIQESVRFALSWPGIKLILLASLIAVTLGDAYGIAVGFQWQQSHAMRLFMDFVGITVFTGISLLIGAIIWRRFGAREARQQTDDDGLKPYLPSS